MSAEFCLEPPPERVPEEVAEMTEREKIDALRDVMQTWDTSDLMDVIRDSLWRKKDLIELIIQEWLAGRRDRPNTR